VEELRQGQAATSAGIEETGHPIIRGEMPPEMLELA
jgi:hypothetical protein